MKIDSAGISSLATNQLSSSKLSLDDKKLDEESIPGQSSRIKSSDGGVENLLNSVVNQINTIDLTSAAADAAAKEAEDSRVYHGKDRIIMMEKSEKTDRMDAVLNRLDTEQQQSLIDSNILAEDDFLALAEQLSDDDLTKLSNVIEGLQTLPQLNNYPSLDITGFTAITDVVGTLSSMDDSTRSRVLEQASIHAEKVAHYEGDATYLPNGQMFNENRSSTANDLHNFVSAVNHSDDVNSMLDDMAQFSESQQSELLNILGPNVEMGSRLMASLEGRDTKAQDAMLGMLSEIAQSSQGYVPEMAPLGVTGNVSAVLDHDNNSGRVVWDMIDDSIALMENYEFNDEQLQKMGEQLAHMSRNDQRAYLSITSVGLEHLVGVEEGQQIDLADHQAALETIESLQNNATVRDEVFKARMGEETISDGRRFYALKEEGESVRDQTAMIELLATDAWMNQDNSAADISVASTQLANALGELGADQRDQLVGELNDLSVGDVPLVQHSLSALQESNQRLSDRIETIKNVESVEALLATEALIGAEQQEDFWRVTALAEDQVDPLLELLQRSGADVREQIISGLAVEAADIDSGEQNRKEGVKSVDELLRVFNDQDSTEIERMNYLDRLQK